MFCMYNLCSHTITDHSHRCFHLRCQQSCLLRSVYTHNLSCTFQGRLTYSNTSFISTWDSYHRVGEIACIFFFSFFPPLWNTMVLYYWTTNLVRNWILDPPNIIKWLIHHHTNFMEKRYSFLAPFYNCCNILHKINVGLHKWLSVWLLGTVLVWLSLITFHHWLKVDGIASGWHQHDITKRLVWK